MALKTGDHVGDYEIVGVLGKGGMGTVFRVRNLLSDRIEAMKVVLPDLSVDPGLADRFLREIRLQASLDHPNIAALRTALRIDNQVLMIMEFVDGMSLDERLQRGALDVRAAIRYVTQILSALELAHSRGIIHRDIKPANIILSQDDIVKLTDFGIARSASDRNLTQTGVALGSLFYMSPEQVQAMPADQRSDIYSLGLTFYEMITGRRAIEGASEYNILTAHLTHTPVAPSILNPSISPLLNVAIMKAIAKHPDDRFQSAAEFRDALVRMENPSPISPGQRETVAYAYPPAANTNPTEPGRAQIETALAKSVGPIAKILMARISPQCTTMSELRDRLAAQITDPSEKTTFLRYLAAGQPAVPTPPPPIPPPIATTAGNPQGERIPLDPKVLAAAKKHLAAYTGPIASVIVDRAARKVNSPQELYQLLATEIASDKERTAFLRQAPR